MVVLHLSIPLPLEAWQTSLSCGYSMEVRTEASAIKFSFSSDVILQNTRLFFLRSVPVQFIQEWYAFLSRTPTAQGQAGQVALPKARRLLKWLHLLDTALVKIMIKKSYIRHHTTVANCETYYLAERQVWFFLFLSGGNKSTQLLQVCPISDHLQ